MNPYQTEKRQDARALAILFFKLLYKLLKLFFPVLIVFLFKKSNSFTSLYLPLITLFVTAIFSFLNYWFFKYQISEKEFKIKSGYLKVTKLSVPLDRIQTVNISQTLLQRLLNIVSLEVDTAGAQKSEIKLFALTASEAQNLKQILEPTTPQSTNKLSEEQIPDRPTEHSSVSATESTIKSAPTKALGKKKYLTYLDAFDLLKVALGENHIKNLLVVIGIPIAFFSQFYNDFEKEIEQQLEQTMAQAEYQTYDFTYVTAFEIIVIALLLGLLVSFIKTFVFYYDFRFGISNERLACRYGMFKTKEINVLKKKIQYYIFYSNPLKKRIGHKGLELRTATSGNKKDKNTIIIIPACKKDEEEQWKRLLIGVEPESLSKAYTPHPFYFVKKWILETLLLSSLTLLPLFFIEDFQNNSMYPWYFVVWGLLEIYICIAVYLSSKKYYFQYNKKVFSFSKGALGQKVYFIKTYKIQSISLRQNFFMKRRNVYHLILHTASNQIKIPYLRAYQAQKMYRFLIEKIEISSKKWM